MFASSLCLSCELRALARGFHSPSRAWRSEGGAEHGLRQRRKPTRMVLADDVSRSKRLKKSDLNSPFGGMNRLDPGPRLRDAQNVPKDLNASQRSEKPTTAKPKNKEEKPLFHALKMQTALTALSYPARMALKDKLDKIDTFEAFGLRPDVLDALQNRALGYLDTLTPSPVQRLAIPALMSKKGQFEKSKRGGPDAYDKFLIAAETGSGKTLAYLLPIIDGIKRVEDMEKAEKAVKLKVEEQKKAENVFEVKPPELADAQNPDSATGRPRAIILLPSAELVDQVGKVVKIMSHTVKYRSAPISSSNSATVIMKELFNPNGIDIIVSTPHLISSIAHREPKILSKVNYIVADEADSLFDRSFRDITLEIIDRAAPSLKQLILCSATIPKSLDSFIDKRFPMMKRLVTPKIHCVPRRVQLGVIDIDNEPYRGNRPLACADAIWQLGKAEHDDTGTHYTIKHIIVFVNERKMAEELNTFLISKGIDSTALTRDTTEVRKSALLDTFTSPSRVEGELVENLRSRSSIPFETGDDTAKSSSKKLANTKVLVTTDLGSRGIDTLAVRHAILYDVPHTTIDFVHRLGRLGRMNRRGRAIVLVAKKDRKDIVREVRDAMFRGQALI